MTVPSDDIILDAACAAEGFVVVVHAELCCTTSSIVGESACCGCFEVVVDSGRSATTTS